MCPSRNPLKPTPRRRSLELHRHGLKFLTVAGLLISLRAGAIKVVVPLWNGDRLPGWLVTQETNHVISARPRIERAPVCS